MTEVNQVIEKLPPVLREEIQMEVNSQCLQNFEFLEKYFSKGTTNELVNVI
jgi:hypothetical protein